MPLNLHHMIMHKIDKTQHQTNATTEYRDTPFTNNQILEKFATSLSDTFSRKTSKEYANFHSGQNISQFQTILDAYLTNSTQATFNTFSRQATELLKDQMNTKAASTGGFVVIIDYTLSFRFILIALVNKKDGYTEDDLNILEIEQLNIDQLSMAGFVNVDNYQNPNTDYRPLAFMRGTREVSDYFSSFLGAAQNRETSSHMTGIFIKALKDYMRHHEYTADEIEELNQSVFSFCDTKRQNKEPLDIASVSRLINPDEPDSFFEFTQEQERGYNLNTVIETVDKQQMNRLKSFSYKSSKIKLTFDKELYNTEIILDANNRLVISNLEDAFIAKIREELE